MENHVERTFQVRYTIKIDEMGTGHFYGHGGPIPLYIIIIQFNSIQYIQNM